MADDIGLVYGNNQAGPTGQNGPQASKSTASLQDPPPLVSGSSRQPKKRLVICCDGTYNNSVSTENPLTNVSRLSRCIDDIADNGGTLQVIYYHAGIGSGTSKFANRIDAATGRGTPTMLLVILAHKRLILHRYKPHRKEYLYFYLFEL